MSYSSKSRVLSYGDAARSLADGDVQQDVGDACRALATTMVDIMAKFDAISKMVHSIDMLGLVVPLRPRWDSLRRVCDDVQDRGSLLTYHPGLC